MDALPVPAPTLALRPPLLRARILPCGRTPACSFFFFFNIFTLSVRVICSLRTIAARVRVASTAPRKLPERHVIGVRCDDGPCVAAPSSLTQAQAPAPTRPITWCRVSARESLANELRKAPSISGLVGARVSICMHTEGQQARVRVKKHLTLPDRQAGLGSRVAGEGVGEMAGHTSNNTILVWIARVTNRRDIFWKRRG